MAAALALSCATLASAQTDAVRALYVSAAHISTNIPGINTYAEPPKGFNPVAATGEELATYGFPPDQTNRLTRIAMRPGNEPCFEPKSARPRRFKP
jgi:hypothetical protein